MAGHLSEILSGLLSKRGCSAYALVQAMRRTPTLYGVDLYENPLGALANIRSKRKHAYEFWLKIGFSIVGVMPDAEGRGKPAILLAKRIDDTPT
jgi:aminoglycoside 6'-N-acetyltransferase I